MTENSKSSRSIRFYQKTAVGDVAIISLNISLLTPSVAPADLKSKHKQLKVT